jgi:large subunit ribosomal protein L18
MLNRKTARLRRAKATRARIRRLESVRLTVHRSNLHIYAHIISADGAKVLASASTLDADVKKGITGSASNKAAAQAVGTAIAQKAKAVGIESVAFDRSGFQFHGRVQALAEAAREAGLKF